MSQIWASEVEQVFQQDCDHYHQHQTRRQYEEFPRRQESADSHDRRILDQIEGTRGNLSNDYEIGK